MEPFENMPFIGSEALAAGLLTRGRLRWNYDVLHPDVYLAKGARRHLWNRTTAAWLWTRRRGIVAGRAAVNRYSSRPVDNGAPVELIVDARRYEPGVITRNERIADDEIRRHDDMRVTTPVRTALDLARHLPRLQAVIYLDSLAAATHITPDEVWQLSERYRGARGIARAREAIYLMDGGSESSQESRLRVLLRDSSVPRPETNIIIGSGFETLRIPIGWRRWKVGVRYRPTPAPDGDLAIVEARTAEQLQIAGWLMVTVLPQHHRSQILGGVRRALDARRRG